MNAFAGAVMSAPQTTPSKAILMRKLKQELMAECTAAGLNASGDKVRFIVVGWVTVCARRKLTRAEVMDFPGGALR